MKRKCQVFISSTYLDLKKERQEAVMIILRQGHIPAGMELFGEDDRTQWEVIKKWIEGSDIVLLMLKERYGSICTETGKSYTQMEYEYAIKLKKPIIRIVIENNKTKRIYENNDKLKAFKKEVMKSRLVTPIRSAAEMGERIVEKLQEYSNEIEDGWIRHSEKKCDGNNNSIQNQRYELMQYLMFAEDKASAGFNRFMIAPKIMMLMDMKRDYNPVEIGSMSVRYSIIKNDDYGKDVYDGMRSWQLHTIRNIGNEEISTYGLYTSTDIGNRQNVKVGLRNCINERELTLDEGSSYKNNGISCWKWEIRPSVRPNQNLCDMNIGQNIEKAWNFRRNDRGDRNLEIIYFIPKSFGITINHVNFLIEVSSWQEQFNMELYKIVRINGDFKRKCVNQLVRDGNNTYVTELTLNNEDMDALFYITIQKIGEYM